MTTFVSHISARPLVLPPGFSIVMLDEPGAAVGHAQNIARQAGAATLVCVRRADMIELAIVLEPDSALPLAQQAHYMSMNALADALASHCPPEMGVAFGWPDALVLDGALIGGGQTSWPPDTADDAVPDWLVFGGMIRLSPRLDFEELPGRRSVALNEIGLDEIDPCVIVESFAHHLMHGVSIWHEQGLAAVHARWCARYPDAGLSPCQLTQQGDLLEDQGTVKVRHSLADALVQRAWYDPVHKEPRL